MLDWTEQPCAADVDAQFASDATGLLAGTEVATNLGWRPVDALTVGDMVLTFDHKFQPIKEIRRERLWDGQGTCPDMLRPLLIEEGLLENHMAVEVMPSQGIMVESDAAADHRGDPFAVLRPAAVHAFGLAEAVHVQGPIDVITLVFEDDEVIYGKCGLHYFAPKAFDLFDGPSGEESYKILNTEETLTVLEELCDRL